MAAELFVVEYRDVIRAGLESLLADSGTHVAAHTANGKEAASLAQNISPRWSWWVVRETKTA